MIKINVTAQNTLVQALVDTFDVGVDTLNIYGGTEPATAETALAGQPLLAAVTLPAPGFGVAASGKVDKLGTWQDLSIDAGGTASFFRLIDNGGNVIQGSVTATGGTGDMTVNNISFVQNGEFTVSAFSLSMPGA